MWTYTHTENGTDHVYQGFNGIASAVMPTILAVVAVDGEHEMWRLDPEYSGHGLDELCRYYRDRGFTGARVAVYDRRDPSRSV